MATRLIGTDDADPRLPALVVAATQGTTALDLAPGDILATVGAVQTWSSPIASGVTVGSGTTTASYARVGQIVVANVKFVYGTGSAITGDLNLNLPVATPSTYLVNGSGGFYDASTGVYSTATIGHAGTNGVLVRATLASGTYLNNATLSATIPFTWATSDIISVTLTYLAAP